MTPEWELLGCEFKYSAGVFSFLKEKPSLISLILKNKTWKNTNVFEIAVICNFTIRISVTKCEKMWEKGVKWQKRQKTKNIDNGLKIGTRIAQVVHLSQHIVLVRSQKSLDPWKITSSFGRDSQ